MRIYSSEKYRRHLQKFLSPGEFEEYGELIHKTAMDVSADRLTRVIDWDKTGEQLQLLLEQKGMPQISFIVSREYQLSGALSFYLPHQPWPHSIEKPERNLWSPLEELKRKPTIFVCELQECQSGLTDFTEKFQLPLSFLGEIETRRKNRLIRNLQVYALSP